MSHTPNCHPPPAPQDEEELQQGGAEGLADEDDDEEEEGVDAMEEEGGRMPGTDLAMYGAPGSSASSGFCGSIKCCRL